MSVGQEFWVVAVGTKSEGANAAAEKESYLRDLKSKLPAAAAPGKFDVPDGERSLVFGSFDNLIRLTDDLAKNDGQVDGILHRLERQYLEMDPKADFKVKAQRQEKTFAEYFKNWQWDEAKYPKSRTIAENLSHVMSSVNKLDEEARNKTAQYNDFKTQNSNLSAKDGTLVARDLVDVLVPGVVAPGDFVDTEHMATVTVLLPKGADAEFLASYETMYENIVPKSAKKFTQVGDKEGNTLWRVVMFKSSVEGFKKACAHGGGGQKKFVCRDFEYKEDNFKKLLQQREQAEESVKRQFDLVRALYQAAWSDVMVAWVHIKAMRVFVESVLRFGMPASFASFVVTPKANAMVATRKTLAVVLGKNSGGGIFDKGAQEGDEGDEFFSYVSFSFTPFTVAR